MEPWEGEHDTVDLSAPPIRIGRSARHKTSRPEGEEIRDPDFWDWTPTTQADWDRVRPIMERYIGPVPQAFESVSDKQLTKYFKDIRRQYLQQEQENTAFGVGSVLANYGYTPGLRESTNVTFDSSFYPPSPSETYSTMEGMAPAPTVTPQDAPRTGLTYPEHYEVEGGGTLLPKLSYNVTTDEARISGLPVPGLLEDIWDSMKKLQHGIPDVQSFNPKDTLNVAGIAQAGALTRMATSEAAGLGAGGGIIKSRQGVEYGVREVFSDPQRMEMRIAAPDGSKAGEFTVMKSTMPGRMSIENIEVRPKFQQQGIATQVYNQVAESLGGWDKLTPSGSLQDVTYNMWKKKNPELLAAGKYVKQEDGSWSRTDDAFSTYRPYRKRINVAEFPEQGVLPSLDYPGIKRATKAYEQRVRDGGDPSAPYEGGDPSIVYATGLMDKRVFTKATNLMQDKADSIAQTIKKEMPDLSVDLDKSSTSTYLIIKEGEKDILKVRVGDHGATNFDSISIDPVTGNSIEDVLKVLRYERGLTDTAPEIGWSLLPAEALRTAMNKQKGLTVWPRSRQIGGRAEYVKGGYQSDRTPYTIRSQTVGTDIQWRDPVLLKEVSSGGVPVVQGKESSESSDRSRPVWLNEDGSYDIDKLRKDLAPTSRSWLDRPLPLDNGGVLPYPAPKSWKELEVQTKMSKDELKSYLKGKINDYVSKDERKYRLRDIDDLFNRVSPHDDYWGVGEGWSTIQDLLRSGG